MQMEMDDYVNQQVLEEYGGAEGDRVVEVDGTGGPKTQEASHSGRLFNLVVVSFGLLCIIQATLNICLRLTVYSDGERCSVNFTNTSSERAERGGDAALVELIDQLRRERDGRNEFTERCNGLARDRDALRDSVSQLRNQRNQLQRENRELEDEVERLRRKPGPRPPPPHRGRSASNSTNDSISSPP